MSAAWGKSGPRVGSLWRSKHDGRVIMILAEEVYGTGPAWRYIDEPNGWHYCDVAEFTLFPNYEPVWPDGTATREGR